METIVSMMKTTNNIRLIRTKLGLSMDKLAEKIGTTRATIMKLEHGDMKLTTNWMDRIASGLGCDPVDLITATNKTVKVFGYVGAGAVVFPVEEDQAGTGAIDEVEAPPGVDPDSVIAVIVTGTSMYPAYREGDALYYKKLCDYDDSCLRKECIVKVKDGAIYVKVLTRGSKPNTFTLTSYNAEPIEDVQIDFACKILWVKKAL